MLEIRRGTDRGPQRQSAVAGGDWLHVVAPTPADLEAVRAFGVPASLLDQVRDPDERPRVETPPFLERLVAGEQGLADPRQPAEFVLRLCWYIADAYLAALRLINARVDQLEDELRRSLRNEEVLGLLQQQKSLTFFATGLQSNELMLERFEALAQQGLREPDHALLAEVRIEMRQAIEMVGIAASVLSDMMDAFASIVSNNLNSVMKVLTSVTILLAVPARAAGPG